MYCIFGSAFCPFAVAILHIAVAVAAMSATLLAPYLLAVVILACSHFLQPPFRSSTEAKARTADWLRSITPLVPDFTPPLRHGESRGGWINHAVHPVGGMGA